MAHIWWGGALVVLCVVGGVTGTAQARDPSGPEFALQGGYGHPYGHAQQGGAFKLSQGYQRKGMLEMHAGVRTSGFYLGGFFEWGVVSPNPDAFPECGTIDIQLGQVTCSFRSYRLGVLARAILHRRLADSWVGVGLGYEFVSPGITKGSEDHSFVMRGMELLNLSGGADFFVHEQVAVGPYVQLTVGRFAVVANDQVAQSIQQRAMHGWLTIGVRVAYNPGPLFGWLTKRSPGTEDAATPDAERAPPPENPEWERPPSPNENQRQEEKEEERGSDEHDPMRPTFKINRLPS